MLPPEKKGRRYRWIIRVYPSIQHNQLPQLPTLNLSGTQSDIKTSFTIRKIHLEFRRYPYPDSHGNYYWIGYAPPSLEKWELYPRVQDAELNLGRSFKLIQPRPRHYYLPYPHRTYPGIYRVEHLLKPATDPEPRPTDKPIRIIQQMLYPFHHWAAYTTENDSEIVLKRDWRTTCRNESIWHGYVPLAVRSSSVRRIAQRAENAIAAQPHPPLENSRLKHRPMHFITDNARLQIDGRYYAEYATTPSTDPDPRPTYPLLLTADPAGTIWAAQTTAHAITFFLTRTEPPHRRGFSIWRGHIPLAVRSSAASRLAQSAENALAARNRPPEFHIHRP